METLTDEEAFKDIFNVNVNFEISTNYLKYNLQMLLKKTLKVLKQNFVKELI